MPIKTVTFESHWWIPTSEIGEEKPTMFSIRPMAKKERDIVEYKVQMANVARLISERQVIEGNDLAENVAEALVSTYVETGFDGEIYASCITEIRNIYVDDDLKDSITDSNEIVNAVAGIVDVEIGSELDDVLWRRSTLEEFEAENFTPTSGCSCVHRTKIESLKKDQ